MQTDTSTRQSHSLIASDRVEGTPVRRSDGGKIGTIERLMIDKLSGNVAYAVLSFGGFLGIGGRYFPLPWEKLRYDTELGGYCVDIDPSSLEGAPSYADDAPDPWLDASFGDAVAGYYR